MEFFKKTNTKSLFGLACLLVCVVSNTAFSAEKKPTQKINPEEIIQAAKRGKGARVLKLVKQNPGQIDFATNRTNATSLHQFAAQGNVEMVRKLIKQGANPYSKDIEGKTLLFKFLQSDVGEEDGGNWKSFVYFVKYCTKHPEIDEDDNPIKLSFGITDKHGNTLLHEAVAKGSSFWVRKLIEELAKNDTKKKPYGLKLSLGEYQTILLARNNPPKIKTIDENGHAIFKMIDGATAFELALSKYKETTDASKKIKYIAIRMLLFDEAQRVEKEMASLALQVPTESQEKEKVKEDAENDADSDEYQDAQDQDVKADDVK